MEEDCLTSFPVVPIKHCDKSNLRGLGLFELPVPATVHHGGEGIAAGREGIAAGREGMVAEADCHICKCLGFILL